MIIIQLLAKTGKAISSKENFQSTQLYSQVHRFIISWNGRRFHSVGCFHPDLAQATRGVTDTYRITEYRKLSSTIINIGQVITQDRFLAIIVHD